MKKERLNELGRMVGTVVCTLSYHPQLALMETVFVRDHPKEYLALEYTDLVNRMMRQAKDGTEFDSMDILVGFRELPREKQREIAQRAIRNSSTADGSLFALHVVLSAIPTDSVTEDVDFVLLDRIHRMVAGHTDDFDYDAINNWANLLFEWAFNSTQLDQRSLRLHGAMTRYAQVVDADRSPPEQKAQALVNRGVRKGQLEDHPGAIADYTAVLEMPDAPPEQKANALSNRGWRQYVQSRFSDAIADFREAIEIAEDYSTARGNLAITLLVDGQTEEALTEYEHALARANLDDISDMEEDLTNALEQRGPVSGAEQVRERIANRRLELSN